MPYPAHELALIWRYTHPDYRGRLDDGRRSILVNRNGATTIVPLDALTEPEFQERLAMAKARADQGRKGW